MAIPVLYPLVPEAPLRPHPRRWPPRPRTAPTRTSPSPCSRSAASPTRCSARWWSRPCRRSEHDLGTRPRPGSPGCSPATCSPPRSAPRSSAASATCTARRAAALDFAVLTFGTLLAAVAHLAARADRGPGHPGGRRRHLPARLRHRPRRVPAREGRRRDRPALGDPRGRRRRRDRALRRDRRAPRLPLAVLDPAGPAASSPRPHLAPGARIAGPRPGQGQLARRGADDDRDLGRAARRSARQPPGAGVDEDGRPRRSSASPSSRPGSRSRCAARTPWSTWR